MLPSLPTDQEYKFDLRNHKQRFIILDSDFYVLDEEHIDALVAIYDCDTKYISDEIIQNLDRLGMFSPFADLTPNACELAKYLKSQSSLIESKF